MGHALDRILWAVVPLILFGCGPSPMADDPFADWLARDEALGDVGPRLASLRDRVPIEPAGHDHGDAVDLPDDAGVERYVRLALERNPAIRSAEHRVVRLTERIPQATSLDDPMLEVAPIGEMAQTAAGEVGVMTGVSQTLPFPGKLRTRGRVAAREAAEAEAELGGVRLSVAAQVRTAYWDYDYAERAIGVTEQGRDLLTQLRQSAEAAYRAGTVPQQDVLRASVELSDLENELITLRQRRATAAARLNALMDRPVEAPLPAPPAVEPEPIDLTLDRLLEQAMQTNAELMRIRQRIAARRQRLELAELDRWPDLNVGLNYNVVDDGLAGTATGDDQWWLRFGVNLPVWTGRLDAAENEQRRGVLEQLADLRRAHNHHAAHLRDLITRVDTQQRRVELFRDVILPQAQQAVDASLSAYRAGDVEFLSVVDNWRQLLEFRRMLHESRAERERAFAEVRQTVGRDIPRRESEE